MICTLCPYGEKVKSNCLPTRGLNSQKELKNIKYLFVGDAPGQVEDSSGKTFSGEKGRFLDLAFKVLEDEGLDLETVALTNVIRCHPGVTKAKKLAKPSKASREACWPYLQEDIRRLQPEIIICFGPLAFNSFFPDVSGGVQSNRLQVFDYEQDGKTYPVSPTYHPISAFKSPSYRDEFLDDLYQLTIRRVWDLPIKEVPVTLVTSQKKVPLAIEKTLESNRIGFDIETDGLMGKVLTVGFST